MSNKVVLFSILVFVLLCSNIPSTLAKPIDQELQDKMDRLLKEDYDYLAQLWEMANTWYYEWYNYDESVSSPNACN